MCTEPWPREALRLATDSFDKPVEQWRPDQQEALSVCQTLIATCVQDIESRQMTMYDTPRGLYAVFARCDRLFFRGQLSDVELTLSTTLFRDTDSIEMTTAEQSGRITVVIEVSKAIPHESLWQTILSTLLHECAHAYFRRVCCWPPKCDALWCGHRWGRAMGPDGHGDVWQSLADAVERVANRELGMERPFQLGRREQVEEQLELRFSPEKLGGRPNARTDLRNDLADNTATISYGTKLRWRFLNDTACGEAASSS
ncbi:hypothetical protein LTR12_001675 [Friedmanniomyces endolithicus]|nr:hypothetical protein LTR12_001675 [Friedmanniomyces endolithicus]